MKMNIKQNTTIKDYQYFVFKIYGLPNDRYFNLEDMLTQIQRFTMRVLKGIRKNNEQKITANLIIALSWFMSLLNQLHIDIEDHIWHRFPYVCSYCGHLPCVCKTQKIKTRQQIKINPRLKPKTLNNYQMMFEKIYPSSTRSLEHAGIHLAEELGELSEAILNYRGNHQDKDFQLIIIEAADLFSCFAGVFNSLRINLVKKLNQEFYRNCHICHKIPCQCNFFEIMNYKS